MSKNSQKSSGQETIKFTSLELENALQYAEGIMEGIGVNFFLLDELGKFVFNNTADTWLDDSIDTISIGTRSLDIRDEARRMLKTIVPDLFVLVNEWQFSKGGVPIRVTIIERKYEFLHNLDVRMHLSSEFKIPNPFNKYWQSRFL